ncbi:MAG: hypothetical protein ACRDGT_00320 [Candidatus Limnocylindria bacterium]
MVTTLTDLQAYGDELAARIDAGFKSHPELPDHRKEHPWLTGWLGDSRAKVWFVSEAASAWRVNRADPNGDGLFTVESQWAVSPGDKVFREALAKAGFKDRPADGPGGWHCYMTVLAKSHIQYADRDHEQRQQLFKLWAPVLAWELAQGRPPVIAAMGSATAKALRMLTELGLIKIPGKVVEIWNYGYLMRPGPKQTPPMDPARIAAYEEQVAGVARLGF